MLMYRPRLRLAGATPFWMAASTGDAELMRMLANAGADPRIPTEAGTTPLMAAAGLGRIPLAQRTAEEQKEALEAVKVALELDKNVNATGERGMTALIGAATGGSEAIIQLLVDSGADINQMDRCGQTALSVAEGDPEGLVDRSDRQKVSKSKAELLRRLGATPQPFTALAPCQHIRHNATKDTEYGEFQGLAPL
jgi:hypothetical protein